MATGLARLRDRDLRAAMHAVQSLVDQSEGSTSFVDGALNQLTGIVASDLTTLSICDLQRGTRRVVGRKAETLSEADRAAFDRHFREHPLVRFHSSHPGGPTQRISDCWTGQAFRDSALHADYYRRIGINYVMALPLRIDNANVISIVFNRGSSDFKDHERAILDVVRQPLAALYRNLIAREDAGITLKCITELAAASGWQMVQVTLSGRILDASPAALRLLQRFFPECAFSPQTSLPAAVFAWLAHSRNWGLARPAIDHGQHFTRVRQGTRLLVHFVPHPGDAALGYLLMKCERVEVRADHLVQLPVTERERDVLALVAAGKTNGEIATILAISSRTVQKHLEHIFQKLGVETRTAAAICALTAADHHVTI